LLLVLLLAPAVQAQPAPLPAALSQFAEAIADVPCVPLVLRGRVYVPAYSSLIVGDGKDRLDLSVTLSIHNTSENVVLVLERIDYLNAGGQPIERYLSRAIALKPYGTIQIVVPQQDIRGGFGANFIVDWTSPAAIDEPLIEAVMIGSRGTLGHSFVSRGRKANRP